MRAVAQLAPTHGVTATCAAFGIMRNALYRARRTNATPGQPAAAAEQGWRTVSADLANITGRHALYFRFTGGREKEVIADVKSFRFVKAAR